MMGLVDSGNGFFVWGVFEDINDEYGFLLIVGKCCCLVGIFVDD